VALGTLAALAVTACAGSTHPAAGGNPHPTQDTARNASRATCAQAGEIIQDLVNAQGGLQREPANRP
jgi:hypothetical protein